MMDKRPLIVVSISAVVLLVLGSLSNVVGYQSVKSTVNDSPLFQTRTQRATNQQQNILTSQYLGMGKGNLLKFPMRDTETESLIKTLDYLGKIGKKSYAQFTKLFIMKIHQNPAFNNINDKDIKRMLQLFKNQSIIFILSTQNLSLNMQTMDRSYIPSIDIWTPGCFILVFLFWLCGTILYNLYLWPQIIKWVIQTFIGNFLTLSPCVTLYPCPH